MGCCATANIDAQEPIKIGSQQYSGKKPEHLRNPSNDSRNHPQQQQTQPHHEVSDQKIEQEEVENHGRASTPPKKYVKLQRSRSDSNHSNTGSHPKGGKVQSPRAAKSALSRQIEAGRQLSKGRPVFSRDVREHFDTFTENVTAETSLQDVQAFLNQNSLSMNDLQFLQNGSGLTLLHVLLISNLFDLFAEVYSSMDLQDGDIRFFLQMALFQKLKLYTSLSKLHEIPRFVAFLKKIQGHPNTSLLLDQKYSYCVEEGFEEQSFTLDLKDLLQTRSYFNFSLYPHLKFFASVLKLINEVRPFREIDQRRQELLMCTEIDPDQLLEIDQQEAMNTDLFQDPWDGEPNDLIYEYKMAKLSYNFKVSKVPKIFPQGQHNLLDLQKELFAGKRLKYKSISQKICLHHLYYSIFHQLANQGLWQVLELYCNEFYFMPDVSGQTPITIMLRKAPIGFITQYFDKYDVFLKAVQQGIPNGSTVLHCLAINSQLKKASDDELSRIVTLFKSIANLAELNLLPYRDQIPLITYLDVNKSLKQELIDLFSIGVVEHLTKEFSPLYYEGQLIYNMFKHSKYARIPLQSSCQNKFPKHRKLKQDPQLKLPKYKQFRIIKRRARVKQPPPSGFYEQLSARAPHYQLIYHTKVQLQKQLIKHKFDLSIKFSPDWALPTAELPNDLGGLHSGFVMLLLDAGSEKEALDALEQLPQSPEPESGFVDNLLSCFYSLGYTEATFSTRVLLSQRYIQLLKYSKLNPCQKMIYDLQDAIIGLIQSDHAVLKHQIIGQPLFLNTKWETVYSSLYRLQNKTILESTFSSNMSAPLSNHDKLVFLKSLEKLKLIDLIDDPVEKGYLNQYCLSAQIEGFRELKLSYNQIIFKETWPQISLSKKLSSRMQDDGLKFSKQPSKLILGSQISQSEEASQKKVQSQGLDVEKSKEVQSEIREGNEQQEQQQQQEEEAEQQEQQGNFFIGISLRHVLKINTQLTQQILTQFLTQNTLSKDPISINNTQRFFNCMMYSATDIHNCCSVFHSGLKPFFIRLWYRNPPFENEFLQNLQLGQKVELISIAIKTSQFERAFLWMMKGVVFLKPRITKDKILDSPRAQASEKCFATEKLLVEVLASKDCYNQDLEDFLTQHQDQSIPQALEKRIFYDAIENSAAANIDLLFNFFMAFQESEGPFDRFPLFMMLYEKHFPALFKLKHLTRKPVCYAPPSNEALAKFNSEFSFVWTNYQPYDTLELGFSMELFPYLDQANLTLLKEALNNHNYSHFSQCSLNDSKKRVNKVLLQCSQAQRVKFIELYLGIIKRQLDKAENTEDIEETNQVLEQALSSLIYIIENDDAAAITCFKSLKGTTLKSGKLPQLYRKVIRRVFSIDTELFFTVLDQQVIDSNTATQFYCLAMRKKDQKVLLHLLNYKEQFGVIIDPLMIGLGKDADSHANDFLRALTRPVCEALSFPLYQEYIKISKQVKEKPQDDFIILVQQGLWQKAELLVPKLTNLSALIEGSLGNLELISWILLKGTLESNDHYNAESRVLNVDQYFDVPLSERVRKSIKPLPHFRTCLNDKGDTQVGQGQKVTAARQKKAHLQEFTDQQQHTRQNHNYSSLFLTSGGQRVDYLKSAEMTLKLLDPKKIQDQVVKNKLEFYETLFFPKNKKISFAAQFFTFMQEKFDQFTRSKGSKFEARSRLFMRNVTLYLQILATNKTNELALQIQYPKTIPEKHKPIYTELLLLGSTNKQETAKLMIQYELRDPRCVKFIQQNYKQGSVPRLSNATLFYVQSQINLFPSKMNLEARYLFKKRYEVIRQNMDVSEFNLEEVQPAQYCLMLGRTDHIPDSYKFKISDLAAAVMSNSMKSIHFVLSKTPNAAKTGMEQNLFPHLVIYSTEANCLDYFNKYIKPQSLINDRLLYRGKTPLLYYVIHKRMFALFETLYVSYLKYLYGHEKWLSTLKDQFNQEPTELSYQQGNEKLYQYALRCGFYQALQFVTIQQADLKLINSPHLFTKHVNKMQLIAMSTLEKWQAIVQIFSILTPYCYITTELKHFRSAPTKMQKNKKEKGRQSKESKTSKGITLNENLKLEAACVALVSNLLVEYEFINAIPNILLLANTERFVKILKRFSSNTVLLQLYLQAFGVEQTFKDPSLLELCKILARLQNVEVDQKTAFLQQVIQLCREATVVALPLYRSIMLQHPEAFNSPEFNEIILQSTELTVLCFRQYFSKPNLLLEKLASFSQEGIDEQEENEDDKPFSINLVQYNLFTFAYLVALATGQCDSQILDQEPPLKHVQDSLNYLIQTEQDCKINKANSSVLLSRIIEKHPITLVNEFKGTNKRDQVISAFQEYFATRQILQQMVYLQQSISGLEIATEGLQFEFSIPGSGKMEIRQGTIFVPLEVDHQLRVSLDEDKYNQFVASTVANQIQNSVERYCPERVQAITEKAEGFYFSEAAIGVIVQIVNEVQQQQRLQITKPSESELFFESLLQNLDKADVGGIYSPEDVFAPHSHEQVRPPEITLQHQASGYPQSQIMAQSSMIQSGLPQQPGLNRQISAQQNQQMKMKEDFQFMFELLPDNTYQVRQRKNNQQQKELIFVEFYHFIQPKIQCNFLKLSESEYLKHYNGSSTISLAITDIYKYVEFLSQVLEEQQQEQLQLNFPVYIKNGAVHFQESLFTPFNIQKLMWKMSTFIEQVKQLQGRNEETNQIQWKISIVSFLEVLVSRLIEKEGGNNRLVNIYAIMDRVFLWDTLVMILHQVLYHNLVKAQQVLKVIRGVYIEFNDIHQARVPDHLNGELDQVFGFGATSYLLYNHMLIIRLNIGMRSNPPKPVQARRDDIHIFKQDPETQEYFQEIVNEYDFYNQVFTPDQLVQFLFNKLTVDRQLREFSQKISTLVNKTITLSVDHAGLARIFSDEIQKAKEIGQSKRIKQLEAVWFILQKLNKYFKEDIYNYLQKQFTADRFENMFQIRLFAILESLRYNKPIQEIINSNERKIVGKDKSIVLDYICPFITKSEIVLGFHFGFQLMKAFYFGNSKLGDICTVCYCTDAKTNSVNACQLVQNSRGGELLFAKLEGRQKLLTQDSIRAQQAYYSNIKASSDQFLVVQIEDIHSIIVYQTVWPSDPAYNQCILNLYFTDAHGNLYLCTEGKFKERMTKIQLEQDEEVRQALLDQTFGPGLLNNYSELSLTQLTPIFPDQINFEFSSPNMLKRQQSFVTGHSVQIMIYEDRFKVQQIDLSPISLACHLEGQKAFQAQLSEFSKFLSKNKELQEVKIKFDDSMNYNPEYYVDAVISGMSVFETFQLAYIQFMSDKSGPKLNNSLQFMCDYQGLKQIKEILIKSFLKCIEFNFETSAPPDLLALSQNGTLTLFTVLSESMPTQAVEEFQVGQFFVNMIADFKKNQIRELIEIPKSCIEVTKRFDGDQLKVVIEVICLCPAIAQLILLVREEANIQIISMFETPLELQQFKNQFYIITQTKVYLVYNNYTDFSLEDFLLDLTNFDLLGHKQSGRDVNRDRPRQAENQEFDSVILQSDFKCPVESLAAQATEAISLQTGSKSLTHKDTFELEYEKCKNSKIFIVTKVQDHFSKLLILYGDQYNKPIANFSKQKLTYTTIGSEYHFILHHQLVSKALEDNLRKVEVRCDQVKTNLEQIQSENKKHLGLHCQFITPKHTMVTISSLKSVVYNLTAKAIECIPGQRESSAKVTFITENAMDLSRTVHLQFSSKKGEFVDVEQGQLNNVQGNGQGDPKLIRLLLKKSTKAELEVLVYKLHQGTEYSKDLQQGNTINMLSKQELQAATRAGDCREDYLEFKDSLGNTVLNFNYSSVILVHNQYPQIQYVPKHAKARNGVILTWTPIFKGVYKLYIDDVRVNGKFIILGNTPSQKTSTVDFSDSLTKVPFYEPFHLTFNLRDEYYNIFGDIEAQKYLEGQCTVEVNPTAKAKLKPAYQHITKFGQINCNIHFEPEAVETQEEQVEIFFKLQDHILGHRALTISGISLEKRRKKFSEALNQVFKSQSYSLTIRRMNFLQDLLPLAEKKMNYSFSIKFQDEPGIDAGGLKREFYDMIGNTLKDDTYKFFGPVQNNMSKYFLHPHFNKVKEKQKYALLFGKLIANAIANAYIIGIDIIYPFWKVVYGEQIFFEDLKVILDESTYKNYEMLTSMSNEDLECLYLNFTYQNVELVDGGQKMSVNQQNCQLYLNKTAEYLVQKQFQPIYKAFIEGFNSVLEISLLQQWFRPSEISLLTQGLLEIKADVILSKTTYSGGSSQQKSFWETYVMQANEQTLRNLLKFITGSSAIPFDQSSYIIQVQFQKGMDVRKLPLSHTCFKSIEVPMYTSYSQLKQKLDIAFTFGLEGYGFG